MRSWPLTWLTVIAAFLLAGAVIRVLPLERGAASEPALGTLFLLALSVAAITTVALLLIVWRQLRLPVSIAVLVVLFNVLVVGVKFVAAPAAVYEANTQRAFETFFPLDDLVGAAASATWVFCLYAGVLLVIFRSARRRSGWVKRRAANPRTRSRWAIVLLSLAVVAVAVIISGAVVLTLLLSGGGLEYLGYVFGGAAAILVAMTLAGAAAVANLAFRRTAERAAAVRDVGVLVSLFWVCLAFLALYHVLWVVYILVLTSVWPLKVVTPK